MRNRLIVAGIVANVIVLAVLFYIVIDLRGQLADQNAKITQQQSNTNTTFYNLRSCINTRFSSGPPFSSC